MNQRLKILIGNIAGMGAGKALGLLLSLAAVPLVVSQIGPRGFGMWAVCQSLITWIQLMDLGLGIGLQNRISHAVSEAERAEVSRAAGALRSTLLLAGFLLVLVAAAAALSIGEELLLVFGPQPLVGSERSLAWGLLAITVAAVLLALLVQTPVRSASGLQILAPMAFAQVLGAALGVGIIAIAPQLGAHPLWGLGALALLPTLFQGIAAHATLRSPLHAWVRPRGDWTWSEWRKLISGSSWLFASQVSAFIVFQTDIFIVSVFLGPHDAGVYQATAKLFSLVVLGQGIVLAALWPALASAWAQGDRDWVRQAYGRSSWVTLGVLIPACAVGALLANPLVQLWTGDATLGPDPALSWGMAATCATAMWAGVQAQCLNATGATRGPAILALVQAAINLPAVLVAATHWGSSGVAWASGACALLTSVPFLTHLCRSRISKT